MERSRPTAEADAGAASAHARWTLGRWTTTALLLLITIGGGVLRFWELDRPALWGDELATWGRVTGTFEQLMGRLKHEGFVPGHYVLYWLQHQLVPLDGWSMRLIPAIAGTLLIPAGFFLARQFLRRGPALVVALFIATSAFALTYSRDAKMYMHTWLFATLMLALFLQWLRSKSPWSLWGWILCGAVAAAFHATALIVLALLPVMLLSHPWRWRSRDLAYFVLGVQLVLAFPGWYYLLYNSYIARSGIAPAATAADQTLSDEQVQWRNSGLHWIEDFNRGIGPWELTLNSATSYAVGLQWPRKAMDPRGFEPDSVPGWMLPTCAAAMSTLAGLMILGSLRWPGRSKSDPGGGRASGVAATTIPWWIAAAWLGVLTIVPTYGVYYCRSFVPFEPPWAPLLILHETIGGQWWLLLGGVVALATAMAFMPRAAGWIALAVAGCLAWTVAAAVAAGGASWVHRWGDLFGGSWLLWPMLIGVPAVIWHRAGDDAKQRLAGAGRLAAAVGIVLITCIGAYFLWRYLYTLHVAKHGDEPWRSIWMPRYLGIVFVPLTVAIAALLMRLPTWPLRLAAAALFVGANLTQGLARIVVDTEPPAAELASDQWRTRTQRDAFLLAVELGDGGRDQRRERDWARPDWRGEFYLASVSGWLPTRKMQQHRPFRQLIRYERRRSPEQLAALAQQRPDLRTIVLWQKHSHDAQLDATDPLGDVLGEAWTLTHDRIYRTRQFWTWRVGDVYRRREYNRSPQPPMQPISSSSN